MKIIKNEKMPPANGHYSQCIENNGMLYLSGQLPINPETGKIPDGVKEQTEAALQNVESILTAAGSCREKL